MKILKYLLFLILAVVVVISVMASMQPDQYEVSRTKLIKAPANIIFDNINDYKNWEEWGPWLEDDPSMIFEYPGQTSGVGATYNWISEAEGNGSMETLAVEENKSIDQKLTFEGFEPSDVYWKFEEEEGGTKVTWGMKGNANFMFRVIAAINGGFDGMIGPKYAKGLEKIDGVITEYMNNIPPAKDLSKYLAVYNEPTKDVLERQKFIGYHHKTDMDQDNLTKLFMESIPKAGAYVMKNGMKGDEHAPGSVTVSWDPENKEIEMFIGMLLCRDMESAEGIRNVDITDGDYVMFSKLGPYGEGDMEAHRKIEEFMKANNLVQNGPVLEIFANDPGQVKPEEIQTNIFYPVIAKLTDTE
ncbi:MAG: GyrI-like domain-containing protein [Flavobacteriaceae bacterium]|nr:GyrI-like domain-containing protein [Flavobacteriaceae bacterium]